MYYTATVPTHFILGVCRYVADAHPAYAGITFLPMMTLLGRELALHTEGPQAQAHCSQGKEGLVTKLFPKAAVLVLYFSFTIIF